MIELRIIAAVAVCLAALVPSRGHAQANCDWYAKTALRQQQENEKFKCGFRGDAWNLDLRAHLAWCAAVGPDAWKAQAQQRDQMLAKCVKR